MSHPTWVRGLKLYACDRNRLSLGSHPTWVRGLKQEQRTRFECSKESHPTWVRGLKHTTTVSIISWLSVFYTLNGRKVTVWILFRYEKVIFNVFNFRLHQKPMKRDRMRCFYWNCSMKSKGVIQILVWFSHQKNGIRITLQLGCNVYFLDIQQLLWASNAKR